MKDIFGAVIGALFPVLFGSYSVLGITQWVKDDWVVNVSLNIIVNLFFIIIILILGVMGAATGSYFEKRIRKKYKKWHGLEIQ